MNALADYTVSELLTHARAKLRGRGRADCPQCGKYRAVSFDESKAVYKCHHAGCGFRGNVFTLAKSLGLARRLSPAEARKFRERRERARALAREAAARLKARRQELYEAHRTLLSIRAGAHERGPDTSAVWGALELVYRELPRLRAELMILEDAPVVDRLRFLNESAEVRQQAVDCVLMRGGVENSEGKFIELTL